MSARKSDAAAFLLQFVKDKPRLPAATRHVMTALANEAATPAWDFFGHDSAMVLRVADRVRQAFEQSLAEIDRPTSKNEMDDLQGIIDKARDLQRAIKISPLPGDWVRLDQFELTAEEMPSVPLDLGWHSLRGSGYANGYPLSICDVLDWAVQLVHDHVSSLPVRSLERQKDQPEVTAFVRRLAWHFKREFQHEHRTAIGHIATAVFDLTEPIDVKGVNGRLKGRKAPFTAT